MTQNNNNHSSNAATKNNHFQGAPHVTPWKATHFGTTFSNATASQTAPSVWNEVNTATPWQTSRSFQPTPQMAQGFSPNWTPSWDNSNAWRFEPNANSMPWPVWNQVTPWNQANPWNQNGSLMESMSRPTWFAPPTCIAESSKAFCVTCELPGVNEKDIDVIWHNGTLVIRGQKREFKFDGDCEVYATDQVWGHFYRAIQMSHVAGCIDSHKVTTKWNNGILEVILPKVSESTESYIKVGNRK